jgi:hypothetical protein
MLSRVFFLFLAFFKTIFKFNTKFYFIFKSNLFGCATMHDGGVALCRVIYGGAAEPLTWCITSRACLPRHRSWHVCATDAARV